jgi:hypothetical protein
MIDYHPETEQMIQEYVTDLATQLGIRLSRVSIIEDRKLGCKDVHLLNLAANATWSINVVSQSELDELQSGACCDRLETKIRAALSRLRILLEP